MKETDIIHSAEVLLELSTGGGISAAARKLKLNRITIRTRMEYLAEELNDGKALHEKGQLTPDGLSFAHKIAHKMTAIREMARSISHTPSNSAPNSWACEQHSLNFIKTDSLCRPIIRHALAAYYRDRTGAEPIILSPVMDYALVYRLENKQWIMTDAGDKVALNTWSGREAVQFAKSHPRSPEMTGQISYDKTTFIYDQVGRFGAPLYHHIQGSLPRSPGKENEWISYQRLVIPIDWNGAPGVASFVVLTNKLEISSLLDGERHEMDEDLCMDHDPLSEEL